MVTSYSTYKTDVDKTVAFISCLKIILQLDKEKPMQKLNAGYPSR